MTKKERNAEWNRQIREIKALGIDQVREMYRAYFKKDPARNLSSAWLASSIASANMVDIPKI